MTITLLCAGALARPHAAAAGEQAAAPPARPWSGDGAFARRIRRARVRARHRATALVPAALPDEAWLRERFALDGAVAACALPPGPGPAAGDARALAVRPVHLHLAPDHVVLAPPRELEVRGDEAEALAAHANAWLADEGLRLEAAEPAIWRLEAAAGDDAELDALGGLLARSARMAAGRNIHAYLPEGGAARRWRQLGNLVQMAWFDHPVNAAREAAGRPAINALWLEGRAGDAGPRPFAGVLAADATLAGLARRAGIEPLGVARPGPDDGAPGDGGAPGDWCAAIAAAPDTGALLVDAGFWREPVEAGDLEGWQAAWRDFDRWFAALQAGSRRFADGPLAVVLCGERQAVELACMPADRWKPWRRLDPAALLREDA